MTRTQRTFLVTVAVTGLLAGGMAIKSCADDSTPGTNAPSGDTGKHNCQGKNSCKGQGGCGTDKGKNSCKGQGGCGADKGKNSCAGKGGCNTKGSCKSA